MKHMCHYSYANFGTFFWATRYNQNWANDGIHFAYSSNDKFHNVSS